MALRRLIWMMMAIHKQQVQHYSKISNDMHKFIADMIKNNIVKELNISEEDHQLRASYHLWILQTAILTFEDKDR